MPVTRFSRVARLSPVLRVDAEVITFVQVFDVDVPASRMACTFKTGAVSRAEIMFRNWTALLSYSLEVMTCFIGSDKRGRRQICKERQGF